MIKLDSAIQGVLSTRDDIDVYRFEGRSPAIIEVILSPVRGVNHALKIWKGDESPVLIKHIDDMRKSSPERMSNLFVEAGEYYISVGYGERDIPVSDPTGIYRLEVKTRAWSDEEREPNDTPVNASELIPGREVKGFFSPAYNRLNVQGESPLREEDWYRVNMDLVMERPVLLDVDLTGVERINSVLGIYNSRMEQVGLADTGGIHEGESIREMGITESGEYFILVAAKNFEANHDQEYRLTVRAREFESGMEMEPNGEPARANTITSGEISGRIFPAGDRDVFLYHGDGRGLYRIELIPPESIDLMTEIIVSDGTKLFEADNGGGGYREVIPAVFLVGNFYVAVQSRKNFFDAERAYTLKVVRLAGAEEYETEPNDRKEQATPFTRSSIKGFTSKKKDRDFYSLDYGRRVRKSFTLQGVTNAELRISITDPFGYSIKSEEVRGAQSVSFTETIDQKGFVIIDSLKENYDEPYILLVTEAK
ncbi:MAG TPA: hypothetical protein VLM75_15080 [Spirochaetota bacterium]|nr:hypothetical protein [Spirochaetota bacterium]